MNREKASNSLYRILFAIYAGNTMSKTAFAAIMVALVNSNILTKTEAGAINGCFWLVYSIGQIA